MQVHTFRFRKPRNAVGPKVSGQTCSLHGISGTFLSPLDELRLMETCGVAESTVGKMLPAACLLT